MIQVGFFNALPIRMALAIIGGFLYGLLTYLLLRLPGCPSGISLTAGLSVAVLYLGSRCLLLFSGMNTPYYSKEGNVPAEGMTSFHQTAQWVGRFYHYHDVGLFIFLTLVALGFVLSLIMDGLSGKPLGQTFFDFLDPFVNRF